MKARWVQCNIWIASILMKNSQTFNKFFPSHYWVLLKFCFPFSIDISPTSSVWWVYCQVLFIQQIHEKPHFNCSLTTSIPQLHHYWELPMPLPHTLEHYWRLPMPLLKGAWCTCINQQQVTGPGSSTKAKVVSIEKFFFFQIFCFSIKVSNWVVAHCRPAEDWNGLSGWYYWSCYCWKKVFHFYFYKLLFSLLLPILYTLVLLLLAKLLLSLLLPILKIGVAIIA